MSGDERTKTENRRESTCVFLHHLLLLFRDKQVAVSFLVQRDVTLRLSARIPAALWRRRCPRVQQRAHVEAVYCNAHVACPTVQ